MKSEDLQKRFTATYVNLRIGMAVIAMAFPILLWAGGALQGLGLQPSMSDDYHAGLPESLPSASPPAVSSVHRKRRGSPAWQLSCWRQ
jgi:hypothetical protein